MVALEKYYGAALLNRTTRAISLTDEGRLLVQGARRLLAEAEELEALIRLGVEKISGPIRLSAPIDLGRSTLVPILDAFLAEHPEVTIDLNLTDGYVDLVGQGQDFAIRYGELADSTLRVKRLVENRRIVCAAPAYLATRGTPQHPDDLVHHECLVMRYGLTTDRDWPFLIDGKERRVMVQGHKILGEAKAIVPSAKKVGGPGTRLDVPITHINASYVRSHFDAMEVGISDAPRGDEIMLALVMTTGSRIHARVGGLKAGEIKGEDGLR